MRPYVLKIKKIPEIAMKALDVARDLFQRVPDREDGEWTCHGMVEALQFILKMQHPLLGTWKAEHGYFTDGYRHSWLINEEQQLILDPYPVACGSGPMLLTYEGKSPWRKFFIPETGEYETRMPMIKDEAKTITDLYWYSQGHSPAMIRRELFQIDSPDLGASQNPIIQTMLLDERDEHERLRSDLPKDVETVDLRCDSGPTSNPCVLHLCIEDPQRLRDPI